ncbi:hypothetical protein MVEN_00147400 [Mycena venus]|uniref:Hydrophobin n=1 Tax=Mycena venus TaxID=2733690 RepID=A0A8H6YW99_9AGAR|nr:hypothetical protein MVEN_00147400 [Mycena venus]
MLITLSAAIPNGTPPTPELTPFQIAECCGDVVPSTNQLAIVIAGELGVDLTALPKVVPIGLSCSPITALPSNCGATAVGCDFPQASWGGLMAINCQPITL